MAEKTNATRKLTAMKIPFAEHFYEGDGTLSGQQVAALLGEDESFVFKTLVTTGKSAKHYVFVVPVGAELDLKKAASAVGEKSIEMLKAKELLPLTGYIHGGCSPIGMKKAFRTTIDSTAAQFDSIIFSGGRIGLQVQVSLENLAKVVRYQLADITTELIHR